MAGIMDWLFGATPNRTPSRAIDQYPSIDDARAAQDAGFGYGSGQEELVNRSEGRDLLTRALLAAAHSAPTALGMDRPSIALAPLGGGRRADYSRRLDEIRINSRDDDVLHNPDPDIASSLAHEATHRGIEKVRNTVQGPQPTRYLERLLNGSRGQYQDDIEERVVRYIMEMLGDPEKGAIASKYRADRMDDTTTGANLIARMAETLIAKQRPGGPR